MGDFGSGPNDGVELGRHQGGKFAGGLADDNCRDVRLYLPLAKPGKGLQVNLASLIEWRRDVRDVACEPRRRICERRHCTSRGVFDLIEALPAGGQHEPLMAPHACLNPKPHLLEFCANLETGSALVGIDENSNGGVGGEKRRQLDQNLFKRRRVAICEEPDGVLLSRNPARRNSRYSHEAAAPEPKVKFHSATAGDDRALQMGKTRKADHGVEDLCLIRSGMKLNHVTLLQDGGRRLMRAFKPSGPRRWGRALFRAPAR